MPPLGPAPVPPPILYKYLGAEDHHFRVLEDLRIRFTQPDHLNDPTDCIPAMTPPVDIGLYVDEIFARNRDAAIALGYTLAQLRDSRDEMVRQLTEDSESLVRSCHDIVRGHLNRVGVLSLTTDRANLTMWAHYSANREGFVIGFLPTLSPFVRRPFDNPDTGEPRPVVYRADRVVVGLQPLTIPADILFVKGQQWSYEQEWRVARRLDACDFSLPDPPAQPWLHLCRVEPGAVVEVVVGEQASAATTDRLRAALASNPALGHVRLLRAGFDAGRTQLLFHPVP